MNSVKLLVCATALVLLWGCTTSRLSDEYFVQTTRDVEDAREVIGQAEVPLGAGDVLYVRRQLSHLDEVSGVADFSLGESAALARIPLRRVGPDASCESHGGSGRLYEYEREFLVAVLASNSSETAEPADRDERSSMLENLLLRNEVALWNCLVENLTIQRPPAGDEGHAGSVLELRVNMDGLLTPLAADSPERARFKTGMQVFPADVVNDVSSSEVGTETQTDTSNAVRTGVESGPRFEIVTAEMDGLSILHPGWPERQWSLLEWDQAGVLQDRHKETSRLLVLKFSKGGDRFYVAECFGLDPTHRVEIALRDGRPVRELVRLRSGFKGWFKVLHQGAALPQSDLSQLVADNVHSVEVGTGSRCGVP